MAGCYCLPGFVKRRLLAGGCVKSPCFHLAGPLCMPCTYGPNSLPIWGFYPSNVAIQSGKLKTIGGDVRLLTGAEI